MSTPAQIRKIHALKSRLKMSEQDYRNLIMETDDGFAVSSLEMSEESGERLIAILEDAALKAGVWQKPVRIGEGGSSSPNWVKRKYENLGERKGMASPAQLRMIAAMWAQVSRVPKDGRQKALQHFIHRLVGVDAMEFIEQRHVRIIVEAVRAMKRQKEAV